MFDNVTIYCYNELQTTTHNFSASNKLNKKGNKLNKKGYGLVCKLSQLSKLVKLLHAFK